MPSNKSFITVSRVLILGLTLIVNWFVIALLLSIFFPNYYIALSILIVFVLAGLSLTPAAEAIAHFSFGCRRPTREEMVLMEGPWNAVIQAAGIADRKYKPQLFVSEQPFPNAFALGTQTICVTRGLLKTATSEEIAGVLAHEVGHLENGDTKYRIIATVINSAGNIAATILAGILIAIGFFSRASAQIGNGVGNNVESSAGEALRLLSVFVYIFALVLKGCLYALQYLVSLGFLGVGRREEFEADDFAKKTGFATGLVSFLRKIESLDTQPIGIWAAISRTHPSTAQRIDRLLYGPPEKR